MTLCAERVLNSWLSTTLFSGDPAWPKNVWKHEGLSVKWLTELLVLGVEVGLSYAASFHRRVIEQVSKQGT